MLLANSESRADVLDFAGIAERLTGEDDGSASFMQGLDRDFARPHLSMAW